MRIKNETEFQALVKEKRLAVSAANQLQAHFDKMPAPAKEVTVPGSMHAKKFSGAKRERQMREQRAEFYTLPAYDFSTTPPDPAVLLYRACVERWGRAYEGGLVVYELCIEIPAPISGKDKPQRWHADIAIPTYRIVIEFDGYAHHSSLDALKRDHRKTEHLHRLGWYVFRVGKERVITDVVSFLDSVEALIKIVPAGTWVTHQFPGNRKSRSFHSLLLSWTLKEDAATSPSYIHEAIDKYE